MSTIWVVPNVAKPFFGRVAICEYSPEHRTKDNQRGMLWIATDAHLPAEDQQEPIEVKATPGVNKAIRLGSLKEVQAPRAKRAPRKTAAKTDETGS